MKNQEKNVALLCQINNSERDFNKSKLQTRQNTQFTHPIFIIT